MSLLKKVNIVVTKETKTFLTIIIQACTTYNFIELYQIFRDEIISVVFVIFFRK